MIIKKIFFLKKRKLLGLVLGRERQIARWPNGAFPLRMSGLSECWLQQFHFLMN